MNILDWIAAAFLIPAYIVVFWGVHKIGGWREFGREVEALILSYLEHRHDWYSSLLVCESDGGCQAAEETCRGCGEIRPVASELAERWRAGADMRLVTRH